MNWVRPQGGDFYVAVPTSDYVATVDPVQAFFGRALWKYDHAVSHDGKSYVVFSFNREDAELCTANFNAEPYDPRD